ncbi:4467_t:CDS:1, partial [Acaulospora colombiana]
EVDGEQALHDNGLQEEITKLTNKINRVTERIKVPVFETANTPTNNRTKLEHLAQIKELWLEERRLSTAIIKKVKRENIQ